METPVSPSKAATEIARTACLLSKIYTPMPPSRAFLLHPSFTARSSSALPNSTFDVCSILPTSTPASRRTGSPVPPGFGAEGILFPFACSFSRGDFHNLGKCLRPSLRHQRRGDAGGRSSTCIWIAKRSLPIWQMIVEIPGSSGGFGNGNTLFLRFDNSHASPFGALASLRRPR